MLCLTRDDFLGPTKEPPRNLAARSLHTCTASARVCATLLSCRTCLPTQPTHAQLAARVPAPCLTQDTCVFGEAYPALAALCRGPPACAHAVHVSADCAAAAMSASATCASRSLSFDRRCLARCLACISCAFRVCWWRRVVNVAVVADGVADLVIRRLLPGASRLRRHLPGQLVLERPPGEQTPTPPPQLTAAHLHGDARPPPHSRYTCPLPHTRYTCPPPHTRYTRAP